MNQQPLFKSRILQAAEKLAHVDTLHVSGTITKISGFMLEALGLNVSVGSICEMVHDDTDKTEPILLEVIGFSGDRTFLMAYDETQGVLPGHQVRYLAKCLRVPVGDGLLGRVINGLGQPIDGQGPLNVHEYYDLYAPPINPIMRRRISAPIDVGVRAINALLTVGQGQRIGLFAGSGVGKSVLLGMMTRFTEADIVVVGLIGERGREVKEFIEENVGYQNLQKTVIIAAPIDTPPLVRANGAAAATSIAEYYRDKGHNVLLIVDSLTRYAQALRQVYLTLGEMPSSKGFSPSVFAKISQLVERTGNGGEGQGSITSFYTVLTEGDDLQDPVADHVRSILDGHIVLSRQLADMGHYPAIDVSRSVSRVMSSVVPKSHMKKVQRFKRLYSTYLENQDLVKMGMYQYGADAILDEAISKQERINGFLQQDTDECADFASNCAQLDGVLA